MERELKWQADAALLDAVYAWAAPQSAAERTLQMDARYFDTADSVLYRQKAGLRLRLQNGEGVCCLKCGGGVSGAEHLREEYECKAETIAQGLHGLAAQGAPAPLLATLQACGVHEICRTVFTRRELTLRRDKMTAELALDCGTLAREGRETAFCEIELEHISGDVLCFYAFCERLTATFPLVSEARSKLVRALAL